jgi:hypothetical protein
MLDLPRFLTPLEHAVISALLEAAGTSGEILRRQLVACDLTSREHNGYGFYTTLSVPRDQPPCEWYETRLHGSALVDGELCGFMLWIAEGYAAFLEGYPLGGDAWPLRETFEAVKANERLSS